MENTDKKIFYKTDENGRKINALDGRKQLEYASEMAKKLSATCGQLEGIYKEFDESGDCCSYGNDNRIISFFRSERRIYDGVVDILQKIISGEKYDQDEMVFEENVDERSESIDKEKKIFKIDSLRADRLALKKELDDSLDLLGCNDLFKLDKCITYSTDVFDRIKDTYNKTEKRSPTGKYAYELYSNGGIVDGMPSHPLYFYSPDGESSENYKIEVEKMLSQDPIVINIDGKKTNFTCDNRREIIEIVRKTFRQF